MAVVEVTSRACRFRGRFAFVTGAGAGIGAATAMLFARDGAKAWVVDEGMIFA